MKPDIKGDSNYANVICYTIGSITPYKFLSRDRSQNLAYFVILCFRRGDSIFWFFGDGVP